MATPATVHEDFAARKEAAAKAREEVAKTVVALKPPDKLSASILNDYWSLMLPGIAYGLRFPPTPERFLEEGPAWLTKALHAAGTLPASNSVVRFVHSERCPLSGPYAGGRFGPKLYVCVEYEHEDPELHTGLLVAFAWGMGEGERDEGIYPKQRKEFSLGGDVYGCEVAVYRFLRPLLPFRTPKYYYGDLSQRSGNVILIREDIHYRWPDQEGSPEPFEIHSFLSCSLDCEIQPKMMVDMFCAVVKLQARLAAWDKLGYFECIPLAMRGGDMLPQWCRIFLHKPIWSVPLAIWGWRIGWAKSALSRFIWGTAARIFPEEVLDPSFREYYLHQIDVCCPWALYVGIYVSAHVDLYALQHKDLDSASCFFWQDAAGEFDLGVTSFLGIQRSYYVRSMLSFFTGLDGKLLAEHDRGFCHLFAEEYHREGGPILDSEELLLQFQLAHACSLPIFLYLNLKSLLQEMPEEAWAEVTDKSHPLIADDFFVRHTALRIASTIRYAHAKWRKEEPLTVLVQKWREREGLLTQALLPPKAWAWETLQRLSRHTDKPVHTILLWAGSICAVLLAFWAFWVRLLFYGLFRR